MSPSKTLGPQQSHRKYKGKVAALTDQILRWLQLIHSISGATRSMTRLIFYLWMKYHESLTKQLKLFMELIFSRAVRFPKIPTETPTLVAVKLQIWFLGNSKWLLHDSYRLETLLHPVTVASLKYVCRGYKKANINLRRFFIVGFKVWSLVASSGPK